MSLISKWWMNDEEGDNDDDNNKDETADKDELNKEIMLAIVIRSDHAPIFKPIITVKPNVTRADMHHILHMYSRKFALTRGILQRACDKAKLEVLGSLVVNVILTKEQ